MTQSPSSPFISVIIPTYNRKDSLRITLDGLAKQTYPMTDFEAVVVSDGSTDGTDAFITEYASQASFRLRPITQANAGPARARNNGVGQAVGTVIVFLDDDVEPVSEFLAAHAAHHAKDEKIVVIGPMSPAPDRRKLEPPWIAWEHAMLEKQYTNWRTGVWEGVGPNHFYSGNASARREYILGVGGFDENFKRQEDVELAYRMQRQFDLHFAFDPAAIGLHRPMRTFNSWLNVASSYGKLDVVMAKRGDASWKVVQKSYYDRNRITRLLADIIMTAPALNAPLRASLLTAARAAHALGKHGASTGALSVIYNLRYLECARAEIGAKEMRRLLKERSAADTVI